MQTWLDWYVHRMAKHFRKQNKRHFKTWNEVEIFSAVVEDAINNLVTRHKSLSNDDEGLAYFLADIATFAGLPVTTKPFAVHLGREAVEELNGAPISPEVRNLGKTVCRGKHVYIDLAHRTYFLNDGELQIRCVFAAIDAQGRYGYTAVVTRPGSNFGCRLRWVEGHHARNPEDRKYDEVWVQPSGDISSEENDIDCRTIDYATLAEVEDFVSLTLAYLDIEQPNHGDREYLPRAAGNDIRRQGRKARQVAKKYSLFAVVKLTRTTLVRESSDRTGSPSSTKRKHRVRGHFRLQACGSGWKDRRLIWISAFERGSGDFAPTPLYVVRNSNNGVLMPA